VSFFMMGEGGGYRLKYRLKKIGIGVSVIGYG
jgi:hypothetical protein